jgi:hypothetical protein
MSLLKRAFTVSARQASTYRYVPGGREFIILVVIIAHSHDYSDIQRNGERPNNLPTTIEITRLIPLGLRTSPLSQPRPTDRSRIRHKRESLPYSRWPPRYQSRHAQSHRGEFVPLSEVLKLFKKLTGVVRFDVGGLLA